MPDGRIIDNIYIPSGKLDTVTFPTGSYQFGYDEATGQLQSITDSGGCILSHYYNGSLLTETTWGGTAGCVQKSVSRGYDNEFRTDALSVNGTQIADYGYDNIRLLSFASDVVLSRDTTGSQFTDMKLSLAQTSNTYSNFRDIASYAASYSVRISTGTKSPSGMHKKEGKSALG